MAQTQTKPKVDKVKLFHELAASRTSKALSAIDTLSNCTNKQSYTYTPAEAEAIVGALRKAVDNLEAAFKAGGVKKVGGFAF